MSIYLRKRSWYYDFFHKKQRYAGCIGRVSRTVAKEEEARKKAAVIEQRLNPAKARKSPRVDVFAQEYLEWVKTNRKPHTYRRHQFVIPQFMTFFGQKKLNDLTGWHLEQYKKARRDDGLQPSSVNAELQALKAMLSKAVTWKKLADHPGNEVKPLQVTHDHARMLTPEEETILVAASRPALRRIIQVGVLTGFRRQELAFLRPADIDFERHTLSVAAAYSKNGDPRTLPMGPRLSTLLRDALALHGEAPTVFVRDTGKPWTLSSLTTAFERLALRVGLGMMGPHVLRHTFASRLIMAGVDLPTVQQLMGHKTIAMTMRYAHLSPDHKRAAMELLESRFSGASPINSHNTPLASPFTSEEKTQAVG